MKLEYVGGRFVVYSATTKDKMLRRLGFKFDEDVEVHYTADPRVAVKLRSIAEGKAEERLRQLFLNVCPWPLPLPVPPAGLAYLPHQVKPIEFALGRDRSYLGIPPGLGKTPIAVTIARALFDHLVIYLTPPSLVENVLNEFAKWAPELKTLGFRDAIPDFKRLGHHADVVVVPDSLTPHLYPDLKAYLAPFEGAVLIVDEAHRFKAASALRTRALFGHRDEPALTSLFTRRIYMSGTPMPNRPLELYPVLSNETPETIGFMSEFDFGRRYCAGRKTRFGWDFRGASNLKELRHRVVHPHGPFMLRMREDVLKLPPLIEETFVLSESQRAGYRRNKEVAALETKLTSRYSTIDDLVKHRLAASVKKAPNDLVETTYRRLLGTEKAKFAVDYVKELLDDTSESLLLFAYHKDAITALQDGLKTHQPFTIDGATPTKDRQTMVNEFQHSKTRRVFILNYLAGGVGFTLTKATRALLVEFDWVDAVNLQAIKRAHRHGQTQSVLAQYLVLKNSLDKRIIETVLRKRAVTKQL